MMPSRHWSETLGFRQNYAQLSLIIKGSGLVHVIAALACSGLRLPASPRIQAASQAFVNATTHEVLRMKVAQLGALLLSKESKFNCGSMMNV